MLNVAIILLLAIGWWHTTGWLLKLAIERGGSDAS